VNERSSLQYVLIIHEVESYAAWKVVFDEAAGMRKAAGECSYQLLRYEAEANRIVHFSAWSSLAEAKRFFESPKLAAIRKQAGVKAPEFIYLQQLEQGAL
jgi:quinol monooxygenase YgiN